MPGKPKNATTVSLDAREKALLDAIAGKYNWKTRTAAIQYCIQRTANAEGIKLPEKAKEGGAP